MHRTNFIVCVVFSAWTIIQTSLHLAFSIYAYYMGICQIRPTQDTTILFYLTYLYNKNCAVPKLQQPVSIVSLESFETYVLNMVETENTALTIEEFVKELLSKLEFFPDFAAASSRTSVFLLSFIILDGAWIVSAVALLMGTCFGIKQTLALVFYGPWLVLTVCVAVFDVAATALFVLDMPQTTNFANWMKFVGIAETSEFEDFDARTSSSVIPLTPSIAIASVSARFILGWLSNWVGFVLVLKATVSVYREPYKAEARRRRTSHPALARSQLDLDTSAARIRSWQLFYGAIDTTSSQSSKSLQSEERDLNSNHSKEGKCVRVEFRNSEPEVPTVSGNLSTYYYAYPDVAESIDGAAGVCLRSQLPWSYIATQEKGGEERIEMESRPKRAYRLKSDSSTSGTEM